MWSHVNFTCEGTGEILTWIVYYKNRQKEQKTDINANFSANLSSVLSVQALPDNGGAEMITCIISEDQNENYTAKAISATLTIKGECKNY